MPPTDSRNQDFSRFSSTSRRRFLQAATAAASGMLLSNCARALLTNASVAKTQTVAGTAGAIGNQTLRIYTWANYTDDELLSTFKDKTGIQVIADTYDSNETMLAKVRLVAVKTTASSIHQTTWWNRWRSRDCSPPSIDRSSKDWIA